MKLPALWNYVINMLMRKFSLIIHEQCCILGCLTLEIAAELVSDVQTNDTKRYRINHLLRAGVFCC
jgi:hypothetical protein